jgi:hypothetical protein
MRWPNNSRRGARAGLRVLAGCLVGFSPALLYAQSAVPPRGPVYDHDRKELESILDDISAWLPGEWSSEPQLHYARTVRMPADGEHEPWYRTFARIDAPQIGPWVFYGQINLGGRDGPLYQRSQILYKASIDEQRGVVLIRGQTPAEPEKFVNLQDHPELWKQVRMRDEASIRCDFIWRRDGEQVVGVLDGPNLDGPNEEGRKYGPGTCSYISDNGGREFYSDSEWTLTPDTLWIYDINLLGGVQFIGRKDRTHTKLYRARPYRCTVTDATGRRSIDANDRGAGGSVEASGGRKLAWMLLRARYPAADGFGLDEQLRLMLTEPDSPKPLHSSSAAPRADRVALRADGVAVDCARQEKFGPLPNAG